ncbi:MAG: tol-pal system YbgF family protein, partial [Candidatus Methylomirabilales bacterium]
ITFVQRKMQYAYDLAAFQEYLRRSPRGKRAADIRFQLIAQTFYQSLGKKVAELFNVDVAGLLKAVVEEEKFLKDYPDYKKVKEVKFFLAVDYYRLYKNSRDPMKVKEYEKLSLEALEGVVKRYHGTVEARAAEGLLETLKRPSEN